MKRESGPGLGQLNERYVLLEVIGRGGMGVVYRAEHQGIRKTVAIKVLRDELIADRQALARFQQEAVAAAGIGHSGIVNVTDYGFTPQGQAFLVMEYLQGRDLSDILAEQGALPAGRAIALARKILAPLGAAHERGIIHRDLKTNNVFVLDEGPEETIKLLDFGVSKVLQEEKDESTGLTSRGAILGTPRYLSPEQAQGEDIDRRADIYAMGVVLHELLSGEVPFSGRSALEVLFAHVQKPPPPLRQVRPDLSISKELEAIVLRALAKDRDERFASAQELDEALAAAALTVDTLQLPAAPRHRRRWLAAAAFGVTALVVLAVVVGLPRGGPGGKGVRLDAAPVHAVPPADLGRPPADVRRPALPPPGRADASLPRDLASRRDATRAHEGVSPTRRRPPRRLPTPGTTSGRVSPGLEDNPYSRPPRPK